ncbi:hypothetical protein SRHO_G00169250 [Serrasalmus rhombeus]
MELTKAIFCLHHTWGLAIGQSTKVRSLPGSCQTLKSQGPQPEKCPPTTHPFNPSCPVPPLSAISPETVPVKWPGWGVRKMPSSLRCKKGGMDSGGHYPPSGAAAVSHDDSVRPVPISPSRLDEWALASGGSVSRLAPLIDQRTAVTSGPELKGHGPSPLSPSPCHQSCPTRCLTPGDGMGE